MCVTSGFDQTCFRAVCTSTFSASASVRNTWSFCRWALHLILHLSVIFCEYMFQLIWCIFIWQVGGFFFGVKEKKPQVTCNCSTSLVFAQNAHQAIECTSSTGNSSTTFNSSFQGRTVFDGHSTLGFFRDGSSRSVISLALPVWQPEWQKGCTLPHLRSALEYRHPSLQCSKASDSSLRSTAEVGSTVFASGSAVETGWSSQGRWTVGQVTKTPSVQASLQFQPRQVQQRTGKRQAERRYVQHTPANDAGGITFAWSSCSATHIPGSTVAYGTAAAAAFKQSTGLPQCCCCLRCGQCSRSEAQVHVCTSRETSRRASSGHPKRDERGKTQGGRSGDHVLAQAGQRAGKGAYRAPKCKRSKTGFAFVLAIISGGTGFEVAGLFPAVSTIGGSFVRACQCSSSSSGYGSFQSVCLQITAAEGSTTGSGRDYNRQRRRRGVSRVQGSCQLKRPENQRELEAPGTKPANLECKRRRADDCGAASHQETEVGSSLCRAWYRLFSRGCSVFSLGRICMTSTYAVHRPQSEGILPDSPVVLLSSGRIQLRKKVTSARNGRLLTGPPSSPCNLDAPLIILRFTISDVRLHMWDVLQFLLWMF